MSRRFFFNLQGTNESLNFTSNSHTVGNVYITGGNVGINTTSPAVTLDVAGGFQATNVQATNLSTGNLVVTNSTVTNAVSTNVSTGTLQAPSGITVGNINFTGSLYQNGTPYLGSQWTTTSGNVSYTSGSVVSSNLVATNSTVTNVQATAISVANVAVSGNLSVAGTLTTVNMTTTNLIDINVSAGSANITSLTTGNVNATNITASSGIITNMSHTSLTSANSLLTNANVTTLTAATLLNTNAVSTNVSAATLNLSTGLTAASANITNVNATTFTAASGIITNASHTSLTSANSLLTNANVTTLTAATLLNTNAVSTNVSSATLNLSTGLTSASAQITNVNATTFTAATLLNTNAVSTNISSATLNLSTGLTSASAQITNLNATNATIANYMFTNMTANNLVASNVNLGVSSLFSGSFIASNNVTAASNVTGLSFSNSAIGAFTATVDVTIIATGSLYSMYTIRGYQNASGWNLATSNLGDATGITFTITSSGQVQYVSSNVTGFTSSTFRYNVQQFTNTGTYTSLLVNTQGSYIVDTIQINSTTDSVRGTSNGGLYALGGATVTKAVNILSTANATAVGSGGSLTVLGGAAVSSDLIVGGNITAASLALSGNLSVAGTLTTVNMTTTNLIDINVSAGSANITNATIATARITSNLLALGNSNTLGNLFTTGGSVGIGTTAPSARLQVNGIYNTGTFISVVKDGVASWGTQSIYDNTRFITCTGNGDRVKDFNVGPGGVGIGYAPPTYTTNSADGLYVNGNVGIGTTAPGYTLDISAPSVWTAQRIYCLNPQLYLQHPTAGSETSIRFATATGADHYIGNNVGGCGTNNFGLYVNGSNRLTVASTGNVGIGTSAPSYILHATGTIAGTGFVGRAGVNGSYGNIFNIYWTGIAAQLWIDTSNLGTITVTSDYRIKKNVQTQEAPALTRIAQIRPVTYELKDYTVFKADNVQREGFIAHELAEIIPSAVEGEKDEENRIQTLKLDALCSVMVKAIQELKAENDTLKAFIQSKFPGEF